MLPPKSPQISLNNYLLRLRKDIKIIDVSEPLKEWHNKFFETYRGASRKIGISDTFYRNIILGKLPIPVWLLKRLAKIDINLPTIIYETSHLFTARNKRNILPKVMTPSLAYYIGYLHGDGHIDSNEKRVSFFDKYPKQLEVINKLTKLVFDVRGKIYFKKTVPTLDIGRVTINSFLTDVIGIKRGKRSFNEVPNSIRRNKTLLKWYLCGLFDAEGSMPLHPKKRADMYIDMAMKDVNLINSVKRLLEKNFNILSYGPYKRVARNSHTNKITIESELRIRKLSEIEKFLSIIGTLHPDKIRRKDLMLYMLKNKSVNARVAQFG